jgi:hypothetical protein
VVFEPNTTSAEPRRFYGIYSEQTIAEASAVVERIQAAQNGQNVELKNLKNLSVGIWFKYSQIFCEYLDTGGLYKLKGHMCSFFPFV